ncbi:lamin tail domain-containing protein [Verrucomicrobiaceae bacterium 227]
MKLSQLPLITCLALALPATGQDIRITEVMTDSSDGGDWFELTNFGSDPINLSGYSWQDQNELDPPVVFPDLSLTANESLIVSMGQSTQNFRTWWGLDESLQILDSSDHPDAVLPRLSSTGDEVILYDPDDLLIDQFKTSSRQEGQSHSRLAGGSEVPSNQISSGQHGYRQSVGTSRIGNGIRIHDLGSPGIVAEEAPFPPAFREDTFRFDCHALSDLSTSEFRIPAYDPNPGDTLTITGLNIPDWLSLIPAENNTFRLSGTPPLEAIGFHPMTLTVTDQDELTSRYQSNNFTLNVIPLESPLILNEYNAVAPDAFLGGGTAEDPDGDFDTRLGRIQGNGGFWAEFVVVGSPLESGPVDLRNWHFYFESSTWWVSFTLKPNPALAAIPRGTILTFTNLPDTSPTRLQVADHALSDGWFWTNINLHDRALVELSDYSANGLRNHTTAIWHQQLAVTVSSPDSFRGVVMGPAGERTATNLDLGSDEVFKLEEDPTSTTSPIHGNYDDGETSTFGAPNLWDDRQATQDFSAYTPSHLPPVVTGSPSPFCAGSQYEAAFTVEDPGQRPLTIALIESPEFLTLTRPTPDTIQISLNRDIHPSDHGEHIVTIMADNGEESLNQGFFTYNLTVLPTRPTVIVNEMNTVAKGGYLNGGDLASDSDGDPAATDLALGRIQSNGGDWFELAVVGDGTATLVDIRGWKIEIGREGLGGHFEKTSALWLNTHPDLAAVPSGTLLLFYETFFSGEEDPRFAEPALDSLSSHGWQTMHFPVSLERGRSRYLHSWRDKGRAASFDLDAKRTQIRILNSEDQLVFGPCGEGIIPGIKVGNDEIFELEAHPSPGITILQSASLPGQPGYDDSDSESTFGLPNRFLDSSGNLISQDFSPYIVPTSNFDQWIATFDLNNATRLDDSDLDGFDNFTEYLSGSSPVDRHSVPASPIIDSKNGAIVMQIRVNDHSIQYQPEISTDLVNWHSDKIVIQDLPSPLGLAFRERTVEAEKIWNPFGAWLSPKRLYFRNKVIESPPAE